MNQTNQGIKVGGKEEVLAHETCIPPFLKSHFNLSPTNLPARMKHDAVQPQLLNTDPLAQFIGTETIANVIIDDAEACALLESGAMADLMSLAYAKMRNFDIRLVTDLSGGFINLKLAVGFKMTVPGYVEYNLQIPGISSDDSDQVALIAENDTQFGQEAPLTIGMKMANTILEAMNEEEIDMLDSIWKRVKNNQSLSML